MRTKNKYKSQINYTSGSVMFVFVLFFISLMACNQKTIEDRIRVDQHITATDQCIRYDTLVKGLDPWPSRYRGYKLKTQGYVDNYNTYSNVIYGTYSQIDSCKCIEHQIAREDLLKLVALRDKNCQ